MNSFQIRIIILIIKYVFVEYWKQCNLTKYLLESSIMEHTSHQKSILLLYLVELLNKAH